MVNNSKNIAKKEFMSDYYRMTGITYKTGLKSIFNTYMRHNIRFMKLYRKCSAKRIGIINKYRLNRYAQKYGLEISSKACIGEGLYLGHPYNITVAADVKIGKNVNLHKGCTIGRENRGKREGVPTIGNNVAVGINSTIIGKITIGNDVMIAPNSFVNFDVPDHSIVVGNPGVIHHKENATENYINFCV